MTDKFYTKPATVKILLDSVDLFTYDLIVEPSAGAGAISLPISKILSESLTAPNLIACDIVPEHQSIQQMNFLHQALPQVSQSQRCLMIGNPPFGRGKTPLAIAFFNRSASYASVQTIAFIVPKSFRKDSVQDRLDRHFYLTREVEIPRNSFTFQGKDFPVYCVIQIWDRSSTTRPLSIVHQPNRLYYQFLSGNSLPASNVLVIKRVGTRAGHCWRVDVLHKGGPHSAGAHFFVQSLQMPIELLEQELKQVTWSSENTLAQPSLTKNEVTRELNRITANYAKSVNQK